MLHGRVMWSCLARMCRYDRIELLIFGMGHVNRKGQRGTSGRVMWSCLARMCRYDRIELLVLGWDT